MQLSIPKNSAIWVGGYRGLVGSAVVRALKAHGYHNLLLPPRSELNLLDSAAVHAYFRAHKIDYALLAAAKVGGIVSNSRHQADFLYENLLIATSVLHAAAESGVQKLLYLGSSCIYPKAAPQPIKEEYLLSGPLEPTNEGYALAKIAGLKLCEKFQTQYGKRFISAMPTNLYGPNDNFHPEHSHVIPGLMRRFHEAVQRNAPEVVIWGSGKPMREFLYVDDLAEALLVLLDRYEEPITINVGTGVDCTIAQLAELMREVSGFKGSLVFDSSKPDGTPRKVLDVSRIKALGWQPRVTLRDGLEMAYRWALDNDMFNAAREFSKR